MSEPAVLRVRDRVCGVTDLLHAALDRASWVSDGHLTILFFTTNVRVMFGTPTPLGIENIDGMGSVGATLDEALAAALAAAPAVKP